MPVSTSTLRLRATALVGTACLAALSAQADGAHDHADPARHAPAAVPSETGMDAAPLELVHLPDAELTDQHGETVRLRELVAGRRAAIQFIFTSCTTVCPPMGALFARLQRDLEARPAEQRDDIAFLSISIDPAVDTPERLAAWSGRFGGSDSWRLLTGPKPVVDDVLKQLGVYAPLVEEHSPLMVLGDAETGTWMRAHGLAPPAQVAALLDRLAAERAEAATDDQADSGTPVDDPPADDARAYFTDTLLLDQNGREQRFYSDLIAGRTVVINPFFATCTGSCPVMHQALRRVQATLGDRLGRDVFFLSITVDPELDTPERLRAYAEAFDAGPGWSWLTGERANVERVLARLGQQVSRKEAHQAIFLVGNARTGLWQKVFGLGPPEDLLAAVREVADDTVPTAAHDPSLPTLSPSLTHPSPQGE